MSLLLLIFYLVLILWVYWLWTRRKFYAMIFKVPGPLGYPILGMGLHLMRREEILIKLQKYAERYGSMLFSWLGPYPFLVISEPAIVQDILTSSNCINKSVLYQVINEGTGQGLFGLDDPKWGIHRKHLNPAFSHKVILSFLPIFNEEANDLLQSFAQKTMLKNDESVDLFTTLRDFTLNIATKTTMGKSASQDSRESNRNLLQSYNCVTENMSDMIFSPWLSNGLIRKLLGIHKPFNKAKEEIRQFIRKLIEVKLTNGVSNSKFGGPKNIFIDQAIDLMRRGIFAWQNVEDESNVIVIGAFETTASTITHVLILLAMFPEYQQKAFEELFTIFPSVGDFEVTYDNIQDMVYMDMVLNETMRVLTPVPVVARENSTEVQLSNGVVLPAGLQIAIDIFRIHRRVDIWGPEAGVFNPDNFLPSNMDGKHPYAFIPFTKGIRSCIGWRYGLMASKVILAKLLRNFRFSTDFQFKDLEFIEAIVLKLKQVPLLKLHKRYL